MIIYDEFSLEKERSYAVFSARAISIIEPNESLVMKSLPTHWYEVLCKKINFELYDQYSVCIHERVHGFYNRLTDYKGVWILSNLPRGMVDYFYDVKQGRVYWGAIKITNEPKWYHISNVIILVPRDESFPIDSLKQLWSNEHIGFDVSPNKDFFRKILEIIPKACIVRYTEDEICRLELYGYQVENKFDIVDVCIE